MRDYFALEPNFCQRGRVIMLVPRWMIFTGLALRALHRMAAWCGQDTFALVQSIAGRVGHLLGPQSRHPHPHHVGMLQMESGSRSRLATTVCGALAFLEIFAARHVAAGEVISTPPVQRRCQSD